MMNGQVVLPLPRNRVSLTTCAQHHGVLSIPTLSSTNAQLFDSRFH